LPWWAGCFHMINHCWFKSCLFLNAGSILYRTGTRDLNQVGGLFHLLPWFVIYVTSPS
jgi:formate hydrogenlyase subunit 3/multisubunit Na+/H+ antiporter MnhD subunit